MMENIKSKRYSNGIPNLRRFHQAKWDEELIFELHNEGERGILVPDVEDEIKTEVGDGLAALPKGMVRQTPPALPEVGQMRVLKHFLRLSQENLGADVNIDIGQGTCTIKYNPKINDAVSASEKVKWVHPNQPEETIQGTL